MKKIVIFGMSDFAQLAHFYLVHDSSYEVVAFTIHQSYKDQNSYLGLPVVPFEQVEAQYPPNEYGMFVPMSPRKMNGLRESVYLEAKLKGYELISYISSRATYFGTPIGENCFVFENNVIQPFTSIGNNVILWSGNHIGHHSRIDDHNFIASHAVVSGHVQIKNNCFLGVNSTITNGVVVERNTFIGAGALITQNTKEFSVHKGTRAEESRITSDKLKGL